MKQEETTNQKKDVLLERRSILFYSSFYEAIKTLSKAKRLLMYDSVMRYGFDDTQPQLPLELDRIFIGIRAQLDANNYKWQKKIRQGEHGVKGAPHGIKGGRPRKKKAENEANNSSNIDDFVLTEEMEKSIDEELSFMRKTP